MAATAENPVSHKYVATEGSQNFIALSDEQQPNRKFICMTGAFQGSVTGYVYALLMFTAPLLVAINGFLNHSNFEASKSLKYNKSFLQSTQVIDENFFLVSVSLLGLSLTGALSSFFRNFTGLC
jgi:hypothetical protein